MHHRLIILVLISNFLCFSQLHIKEGTTFTLLNANSFLSTKEYKNTINTTISGQGSLVFNRNSEQVLTSAQAVLILPNLVPKNADLIRIETVVSVPKKLFIYEGELVLLHDLHLQDNKSLVLFNESKIKETEQGKIVINSNLFNFFYPIAYMANSSTVVSVKTKSSFKTTAPIFTAALRTNLDLQLMKNYIVYIILHTPPPKISYYFNQFFKPLKTIILNYPHFSST
jgi:hypothetical protein